MKRRFAIPMLLLAPLFAQAADLFEQPATIARLRIDLAQPIGLLRDSATVRGRFVQLKHLDGFPQPLRSSGDFLFVRGLGMVWHTAEPFESQFILDAAGIRAPGQASLNVGATTQPVLRMVSGVFLSLFDLDLNALAEPFELFSASSASGWTLGLRPRDAAVAAVANRIRLSGRVQIEHIELSDAHGDRTEIVLQNVVTDRAKASAVDRARFAP